MGVKLGNGKWAIKEDKLLAYNDNSGRFFNKEFDFSRGSSATYVAKDGLIKNTTGDIPRIDFSDSVKGALLLEPQSTNLITYSEDFTGWAFTSASKTLDNNVISPSGVSGVQKLIASSGSGFHFADFYITISGKNSFSVFLKKGTTSQASMFLSEAGNYGGLFDLENGLIESVSGSDVEAEIIDYGSGWYRCILKHTSTDDLNNSIRIGVNNGALNGFDANGDETIYMWGAQLEALSFPTSYIPTFGSTATRLADVCNSSGSAQDFNSEEGVLYAEIAALADDGTNRLLSINDSTSSNSIWLYFNTANNVTYSVRIGGVAQASATHTIDIKTYNKIAIKYKENDFAVWFNGIQQLTDTSGNTYTSGTLNNISFDAGDGALNFYGKVRELQVFTEALTDEQLQKLTTI